MNLLVFKNISKKAILRVCLFLFVLIAKNSYSQPSPFSKKSETIYLSILEGNIESINNPTTSEEHYLLLYQTTLQLLLVENISNGEYEEVFQEALGSFNKSNKTASDNYFESESRLLASFAYLKYESQIDAAWQLRQSYKIAKRNHEQNPDFLPSLKTLGLLEIIIGSVPEKYQWLLSLAGLHGSVQNGQKCLEEVIKSDSPLSLESKALYSLAQAYVLDDNLKSTHYLTYINNTPLMRLVKAAVWSKTNNGQEIINLSKSSNPSDFSQIHYLTGEAYLQSGDYTNSISYLKKFLKTYNGKSNLKDTFFKLYLCNLFLNENDEEAKYELKAKEVVAKTAADRNAEKLLNTNFNEGLMKMRLATDGGFYPLAISQSQIVVLKSKEDSVEYIYRLARLQHKMNNMPDAIRNYQTTIKKSKKENWYYAPNSALQLGHIYESRAEFDSSKFYYKAAIHYNNHLYKNSIDAKSEAGLNRIEVLLSD